MTEGMEINLVYCTKFQIQTVLCIIKYTTKQIIYHMFPIYPHPLSIHFSLPCTHPFNILCLFL